MMKWSSYVVTIYVTLAIAIQYDTENQSPHPPTQESMSDQPAPGPSADLEGLDRQPSAQSLAVQERQVSSQLDSTKRKMSPDLRMSPSEIEELEKYELFQSRSKAQGESNPKRQASVHRSTSISDLPGGKLPKKPKDTETIPMDIKGSEKPLLRQAQDSTFKTLPLSQLHEENAPGKFVGWHSLPSFLGAENTASLSDLLPSRDRAKQRNTLPLLAPTKEMPPYISPQQSMPTKILPSNRLDESRRIPFHQQLLQVHNVPPLQQQMPSSGLMHSHQATMLARMHLAHAAQESRAAPYMILPQRLQQQQQQLMPWRRHGQALPPLPPQQSWQHQGQALPPLPLQQTWQQRGYRQHEVQSQPRRQTLQQQQQQQPQRLSLHQALQQLPQEAQPQPQPQSVQQQQIPYMAQVKPGPRVAGVIPLSPSPRAQERARRSRSTYQAVYKSQDFEGWPIRRYDLRRFAGAPFARDPRSPFDPKKDWHWPFPDIDRLELP